MEYFSTRGGDENLSFEQAVLRGLAPNGGLYIPASIPPVPSDWSSRWATLSYPQLAFEVLSLYIPDSASAGGIPAADLREIITRSYSSFRDPAVAPVKKLDGQDGKEFVLELWHGPTFAFKDVALQLLGNLFEYFLKRRNQGVAQGGQREKLTVLGATSGDTGSAAIAGLRSKADISIFILFPKGRVSPIQEAQMTTVLDENVHNVAVEGTFDDCQDIVKHLFSDADFNAKHRLGAINSINIARILAQIVYYFSSYFLLRKTLGASALKPEDVQYVVPTGNFGDILAGYYAKRMGLPIHNLVVATNENDILTRFWKTGRYEKNDSAGATAAAPLVQANTQTAPVGGSSDGTQADPAKGGGVKSTLSPAMDILVSSNFERLLWYIAYESLGDDRAKAGEQLDEWMKILKETGSIQVSDEQLRIARRDFTAERVSDDEIRQTILRYYTADKGASYLVDPHTAVGLEASSRVAKTNPASTNRVVLSTAHPAKFAEAVTSSLASAGAQFDFERDVLPAEMRGLLEKERRVVEVSSKATGAGGSTFETLVQGTRDVVEKQAATAGERQPQSGPATTSV